MEQTRIEIFAIGTELVLGRVQDTNSFWMAGRIAGYDRGYEGGRRRCPRWGKWQKYKGERAREVAVDGGTLTVQRAYYVCAFCGETSYPLDERLGLVEGHEQGRLREKLTLVAVLVPYHQAP